MSTAREFATFLNALVNNRIYDPVMVWGAPGIGKSSTVIQIAKQHNLELIDLRISQITPADLRGLPAPNLQEGTFEYLPPSFLPRPGAPAGILFLDEITQAPPAVQAITQQLILDRKIGSYCYDDQTKVMTETGLKLFRDLEPTDRIMTLNPNTNQVEYHLPTDIISLDHVGEMHHFQGKGISLKVSPDHNMYVRANWEDKPKFVKAKDLAAKISKLTAAHSHYRVKRNGDWNAPDPQTFTLAKCEDQVLREDLYTKIADLREQKIPVATIASNLGLTKGGVEARLYYDRDPKNSYMPAKTFDLGDWAEFMGWYVAEGCISKEGVGHSRITICQSSTANAVKYSRILELLTRMGFVVQQKPDGLLISNKALCEYLRPYGKQLVRKVPQEIKAYPKYALKRFLEAVLLGDGTDDRRLFTASSQLRDDYCEIAIKLGYAVTFQEREGSGLNTSGSKSWQVGLSSKQVEPNISKVETTQYDGKIYCVTVPNHILMVERDGKLAWCGNCLPDNWFVWAAGNRQQDKTSVYAMPTALANRFHHFDVVADFDTWKLDYAIEHLDPAIISFLSLRPELLHKMNVDSVAWPSPRSWAMANRLYQADISISHAVGPATAAEFNTFLKVYQTLPDLDAIAKGQGDKIDWPKEESIQYAVTVGLQMKCIKATKAEIVNVIKWLGSKGKPEYSLRALNELIEMGPERIPHLGHMLQSINKDPDLLAFIKQVNSLKRQAEA